MIALKHLPWMAILMACLVYLSLFTLDGPLAVYFARDGLDELRHWMGILTELGLAGPYLLLAFGMALWSSYSGRNLTQRRYWWGFLYSLLLAGVILHIFKSGVGRARPYHGDLDPFVFSPLSFTHPWHSFPSGHTQVVAVVGYFAYRALGRGFWWIWLVVAFLAFTRVMTGNHFLSDLFAGAYVGLLASSLIDYFYIQRRQAKE